MMQMESTTTTTPTMRELHAAHKARLARFSARALVTQPSPESPSPEPEQAPQVLSAQQMQWAAYLDCLKWMAAEHALLPDPDPLHPPVPGTIATIRIIQRAACQRFGIELPEMLSISRRKMPVHARQVATYR